MTTQTRFADPFSVDPEAPRREYREARNRTS